MQSFNLNLHRWVTYVFESISFVLILPHANKRLTLRFTATTFHWILPSLGWIAKLMLESAHSRMKCLVLAGISDGCLSFLRVSISACTKISRVNTSCFSNVDVFQINFRPNELCILTEGHLTTDERCTLNFFFCRN